MPSSSGLIYYRAMSHENLEGKPQPLNAVNIEAWDPKAALKSLAADAHLELGEGGDERTLSERLLKENAPQAALAVVHLAQNAQNDTVRFKAASYILDRVMGRVGPDGFFDGRDPFEKLLADCVRSEMSKVQGGGDGRGLVQGSAGASERTQPGCREDAETSASSDAPVEHSTDGAEEDPGGYTG